MPILLRKFKEAPNIEQAAEVFALITHLLNQDLRPDITPVVNEFCAYLQSGELNSSLTGDSEVSKFASLTGLYNVRTDYVKLKLEIMRWFSVKPVLSTEVMISLLLQSAYTDERLS